jgi:hypothetical protein
VREVRVGGGVRGRVAVTFQVELFLERADAQEIKRSASDQRHRDEDRSKASAG